MGHGRQVQATVGGSAGRRHDDSRVLKGLSGDDVAGSQLFGDQPHNGLARRHRIGIAGQIGRRQRGRQRQGQADRFRHARHGVGCELAAARTIRRTGVLLQRAKVLQAHPAGRVHADTFEHVHDGDIPALPLPGQDRAAVEKHRRHIQAQHRHHHARKRLVAAGQAHQGIIAVATHGQLNRVGDQVAADQRRAHPLMAHRDAIGDGDGAELARRSTGLLDAFRHRMRLTHQRGVAGCCLVPAGRDADERLGDLATAKAHGVVVGAVRRTRRSFGHMATGKSGLVPGSVRIAVHVCALKKSASALSKGVAAAVEGPRRQTRACGGKIGPGSAVAFMHHPQNYFSAHSLAT